MHNPNSIHKPKINRDPRLRNAATITRTSSSKGRQREISNDRWHFACLWGRLRTWVGMVLKNSYCLCHTLIVFSSDNTLTKRRWSLTIHFIRVHLFRAMDIEKCPWSAFIMVTNGSHPSSAGIHRILQEQRRCSSTFKCPFGLITCDLLNSRSKETQWRLTWWVRLVWSRPMQDTQFRGGVFAYLPFLFLDYRLH